MTTRPAPELDAPPWQRVEATLITTARLLRDAYDQRFAELDLNLTQAIVLVYVADFGPVTQTKIADHLGQGRAATGVTIDRLQTRGLVDRHPDPADRRVWQIQVTDAGRALIERVTAIDTTLRTELRAGISRADRQALTAVLQQLQTNLKLASGYQPGAS
ncbi:MAG: MarR family transcriptional regulator [Acidimicrobiia bacterium]|nr:MarR family transcriptional regulator [Acidimicrobiia bacterium]